jgi:acyl-CoA synthetase (AMP-forming)/AMP-acid ligase II
MLVLAIIGVGGVYTGTNPTYTTAELSHHIKTSKSKFLISEPEIIVPLLGAATANNVSLQNIWIFDPLGQLIPSGHKSWRDLLNYGEQDWVCFNDAQKAKTRPAARLFSSGTTGLPKGANLTHYNLISQHELTTKAHPRPHAVSLSQKIFSVRCESSGLNYFIRRFLELLHYPCFTLLRLHQQMSVL